MALMQQIINVADECVNGHKLSAYIIKRYYGSKKRYINTAIVSVDYQVVWKQKGLGSRSKLLTIFYEGVKAFCEAEERNKHDSHN